MPELNDREADKLFQTGAERHDYTYNPDAWEQMEMMLDADKRRSVLWFQVAGVLAFLVLIGLALFYYYSGDVGAEVRGKAEPSQKAMSEMVTPSETEERNYDDALGVDVAPALTEGTTDSSPLSLEGTEAVAEATQDKPALSQASRPPVAEQQSPSGTSSEGRKRGHVASANVLEEEPKAEKGNEERTIDLEHLVTGGSSEPDKDIMEELTEGVRLSASTVPVAGYQVELLPRLPLPRQVLSNENSLTLAVRAADAVDTVVTAKYVNIFEEDAEVKNSLALGVGAGIILGRSGADPFAMAQPRLGLDVEYRRGNKFAVSTGAYFNQVCYRTSGENYTAKSDFWTDGIEPETVQGECNVLEIPLSLSYYFNGSRKNSFYVSAGTVSYLMLKEDYSYEYDATAPADARKGWREENNNQHFLGLAQFNVGFQKTVGGKSALKLETYVHLPLTGVGHGQVRLFSAGVTAKYLFDFRK